MIPQLSPRDWEILSAYLDRQLRPKEIVSLETRLSADPDLSAALGELQRTRDALRNLPRLRAPRNFTLTPQMVGQRSAWRPRSAARLAPVFGFASALATFLLILVIVGDWLGILAPSTAPVAQAPTRAPQVSAQQIATATLEAPAPPLLGAAPQPTAAASLDMQAQQSPQTITETTPMTLTVGALAPSASMAATSSFSETATESITMTAKNAAGLGSGEPPQTGFEALPSDSMVTPLNPVWVTTLQVTVSPTETLSFPMTVTLDGIPITGTFNLAAQNEQPVEGLTQAEPTSTITPEPPPAPTEVQLPAPTSTPEVVARAVETPTSAAGVRAALIPTPSQPEPHANPPATIPSPTLAPGPKPARQGLFGLRILEIMLALLALAAGLAAGIFWWSKRF